MNKNHSIIQILNLHLKGRNESRIKLGTGTGRILRRIVFRYQARPLSLNPL